MSNDGGKTWNQVIKSDYAGYGLEDVSTDTKADAISKEAETDKAKEFAETKGSKYTNWASDENIQTNKTLDKAYVNATDKRVKDSYVTGQVVDEEGNYLGTFRVNEGHKFDVNTDLIEQVAKGLAYCYSLAIGDAKATGSVTDSTVRSAQKGFDYWYKNSFLVKGYRLGGIPENGDLFYANEGTPEFIGSFGNRTVVANNDQIVNAVANGVAMANDRMVNAIEQQTNALEGAIDRKNLNVSIGDKQIAEANRRGERGLGVSFVN